MENKFNEEAYKAEWSKKNMKFISAKYKNEFVDEFKEACNKLGLKQSDVFRKAMQEVIEKANG